MRMTKSWKKMMGMLFIATLFATPYAAAGQQEYKFQGPPGDRPAPVVELVEGENWVVAEATRLSKLTIAEGARITAPDGYSLTMTIDHVETGIAPGTYQGRIVLTPTEEIKVAWDSMGATDTYYYRTALYVDDGRVIPEKSVLSAVNGGKVTDVSAKNIKIRSVGKEFNGIMVTGDSIFTLHKPKINFTGNGGNDFAGFGAAIMTEGNADVVIDRAEIITSGVVRTAVWAGGNSTVEVNEAYIETHNGILPDDYSGGPFGGGGVMMEVPWMLGITGNCRATNALGKATVYYNNSHIKAQAWGALSTDAVQDVKLYATNCLIETEESGYGAYADGNALDTFSACRMNVADMGLIMTAGSGVFTDGSVVNSGRFGVLMHGGGSGRLTIDKGSVFNTDAAVIQIKGNYPTILVDQATLNSKSGIILESFANDDPFGGPGGGGPPPGQQPPPGQGPPPDDSADRTEIQATFKNTRLAGDIVNGHTEEGGSDVVVSFQNASIKGAITTAVTERLAEDLTMADSDLYDLIGQVIHTYCAVPGDPYGLKASFDGSSKWVVTETSYLNRLAIAEGAVITAPACHSLAMTVDGIETAIGAGTYEGAIVLFVTETSACPEHPGLHHGR